MALWKPDRSASCIAVVTWKRNGRYSSPATATFFETGRGTSAHRASSAEKLVDFLIADQSDSWEEVPIRNIRALPTRTAVYLAGSKVYRPAPALLSLRHPLREASLSIHCLAVVFVSCSFSSLSFPSVAARYATSRSVAEDSAPCEGPCRKSRRGLIERSGRGRV